MSKIENVKCPICDGPMTSRKSEHGCFFGCMAYPRCKGTRDSMGRSKAEREDDQRTESARADKPPRWRQ